MSKTDLKGLGTNTLFSDSAAIILKKKYKDAAKKAGRFLDDCSVENLHSLRISIRRLRYSLENYEVCFSRNSFQRNIDYLKNLQDLIGVGRDLDMIKEHIDSLALECQVAIEEVFYECIRDKKNKSLHEIKLELLKFLHNKDVRNFFLDKKED
ncbi:MAG TPA: CHAD domain-containing protein [Ignavibacteriales bacterium]|nr:CHAD domain-containing protein [Ignavibacteriales bacterium]